MKNLRIATMKELKDRIQYLMDQKKCDQIDISRGINVDRSRVSEWVTGKVTNPRRATLRKLADFFDCRMEWIADGSGEIFGSIGDDLAEETADFQNQKRVGEISTTLDEIKREKFKRHCSTHFDDFFDFIADIYGENKKGIDCFLSDLQQTNTRYRQWVKQKKQAENNNPDGTGEDSVAANE